MIISIITATHNSEATIGHTLECIRRQDYPSIEHIIVDGKSTDGTINTVQG
ncbi:MAG: glycosyltransferase, partial [Chitinophagales bacterium]